MLLIQVQVIVLRITLWMTTATGSKRHLKGTVGGLDNGHSDTVSAVCGRCVAFLRMCPLSVANPFQLGQWPF